MKTFFITLLLFSSSALAEYQWSAGNPTYTQFQIHLAPDPRSTGAVSESANAWTSGDTYREVAFQVFNFIDWGQTRFVAQNPPQCILPANSIRNILPNPATTQICPGGYSESDSAWIIGAHPSVETVDTFMSIVAVSHFAFSYYLDDWRSAFQYISIGFKLNVTVHNASIGVKVSF